MKCCCIFNYPPHYRTAIYSLMDKQLKCDFYFGDKVLGGKIEELDCSSLDGFKGRIKNIFFAGKIIWQKGALCLLNKDYTHYILSLDKICISEILFLIIARFKGKKTYLWTHGWYGNESKMRVLYKKLYFLPVTGFFLYGEYARNLMLKEGFNPNKLYVIGNSLDYDAKLQYRKPVGINYVENHFKNGLSTIVFVGRLSPEKQLDQLIDCCRKINEHGTVRVNCLIIGDGQMRSQLENRVAEYHMEDSVWFFGACYNAEELAYLVGCCDLCVSPGNVGLTAIDCLSYGTPVCSHNDFPNQMPEFEAIIPGKTGDFFKRNDINDMTRVVENWLIRYPQKSKECISACYEIIDNKYNPYCQINVLKSALI